MNQYGVFMDIAMNLTRIGNWAADDFSGKKHRIEMFLTQTDELFRLVKKDELPLPVSRSLSTFLNQYSKLRSEFPERVTLDWAEECMTWGNILTHRAQLLSSG